MRKIWQVITVTVVGLALGLASVGCGSSPTAGKDKMGSDKMHEKMSTDKMGDKMHDKMSDKMHDKMGDKMDDKK
jgi:hypothetical protein